MAPVITALRESTTLDFRVTVTGQHRAMLDQVNELFGIEPDHDLDILEHGQELHSIMTRTIDGLSRVLAEDAPAAVLVQGDTTTSTAAAIAAFYREIPVVHLEAGLRSGNLRSPFPEEANRKITSQIAGLHLAPTSISRDNLLAENVPPEDIVVTGNTVIDALLHVVTRPAPFSDPRLEALDGTGRRILLVTTHRRENQGSAMRGMARAIARIAANEPDLTVVLPLHMNPVVRDAIVPTLKDLANVILTEPLGYGEFARLLSMASVVLTDSGGVQEEAPSLGKPVLVMRENTERPEAVSAGTVALVGADEDVIVSRVTALLHDDDHYASMATAVNPYGDGRAAERVVAALEQLLGLGTRLPDFTPREG